MLTRLEKARNHLKNRRGFSIVEILIVVTIIGFFVGMSMMNNAHNAENSKTVVAKADCRNILAAIVLHDADVTGTNAIATGAATNGDLCNTLRKTDNGRVSGSTVGPWMATCPSTNPWGNPYTYTKDATSGAVKVSTTNANGVEISTDNLDGSSSSGGNSGGNG